VPQPSWFSLNVVSSNFFSPCFNELLKRLYIVYSMQQYLCALMMFVHCQEGIVIIVIRIIRILYVATAAELLSFGALCATMK